MKTRHNALSAGPRSLKPLQNVFFFAYIKSLLHELVFTHNKSNLVTEGDDLIAIGFILTVNADFCDDS